MTNILQIHSSGEDLNAVACFAVRRSCQRVIATPATEENTKEINVFRHDSVIIRRDRLCFFVDLGRKSEGSAKAYEEQSCLL